MITVPKIDEFIWVDCCINVRDIMERYENFKPEKLALFEDMGYFSFYCLDTTKFKKYLG